MIRLKKSCAIYDICVAQNILGCSCIIWSKFWFNVHNLKKQNKVTVAKTRYTFVFEKKARGLKHLHLSLLHLRVALGSKMTSEMPIIWSESQAWRSRKSRSTEEAAPVAELSPVSFLEIQHNTSACIQWLEWSPVAMASAGATGQWRVLFWVGMDPGQ